MKLLKIMLLSAIAVFLLAPAFAEKKDAVKDKVTCLAEAKAKYDKGKKDCKGIKSWKQATCLKGVATDYKKSQAACGNLGKVKKEGKDMMKGKGLDKVKNFKKPW